MCAEAGRHRLQGDEGVPGGSGALGSTGLPPHCPPRPGPLAGAAWTAQRPCPATSPGRSRLDPRKPSGAGAGVGQDGFCEGPAGRVTHIPLRPPQTEGYVEAEVASDTLVALSRNHFSLVMYELQHHLKPLDLTDEFVIVTLAKLAHGNGRARGSPAPASGPLGPAHCPSWWLPFCLPFSSLPPPLQGSVVLSSPGLSSLPVPASLPAVEILSPCFCLSCGLQPSVMPCPLNLALLPSSRASCFSPSFLSLSPLSLVPSPRAPQTGSAGTGVGAGPPCTGSALTKDRKQENRRLQFGTVGVKGTTGGCVRPG